MEMQFSRTLAAVLLVVARAGAPAGAEEHGIGHYDVVPYTGSREEAEFAAASRSSVPLSSFSRLSTKDDATYSDMIVGGDPFLTNPEGTTTITIVVVPVKVEIGKETFDPTESDPCIPGSETPLAAFESSPLIKPVKFDGGSGAGHASLINGTNGGTTIYNDAMRRAEFWSLLGKTDYHLAFKVVTEPVWTISAAEVKKLGGGAVLSSACAKLGVLHTSQFRSYVTGKMIPGIPAITPTTFALFLMKDVVTTEASTLNCRNGCTIGYHGALGAAPQTFAVVEYDTTESFWFDSGITNISIIAHELGEWLDDPLGTNPTPAWGNIGQVSGCQGNWEVGDPLTGTDFPAITAANGLSYDPQELVFYSWYYNADGTASLGAGGKYSMNGTFSGPSQPCPPGGTY